jgi:hypothetical protein
VLVFYDRFPEHLQNMETVHTIRLSTNLFTVMTSLVLGLMINSGKATYDAADRNVHVFATDMILFDRTLKRYGPETGDIHAALHRYLERALATPIAASGVGDRTSEAMLNTVGDALDKLKPVDDRRLAIWRDAQQQFRQIVEMRWTLLGQAGGTIPIPLLILLGAWLVLIFGSFGYLAPRNRVTVTNFILSAFLVSGAIYLILDMDSPYGGPIHISKAPLARALAEIE